MTVHNNGDYSVSYVVTNDNVAVQRDFWWEIGWNNQISFGKPSGRVGRMDQKTRSYSEHSSGVQVYYPAMLQMPPTLIFHSSDRL